MVLRRLFLASACALVASLAARADEPSIIAKARSYIGPEAVLNAVTSIHFVGTMTGENPQDPTRKASAKVEIIFQKPAQHRITIDNGHITRTIALDGYDVWERDQDSKDPRKSTVNILPVEMIHNLTADVWENLYFYRGIEGIGGHMEDQGPATIDGVACEKIGFIHSPSFAYYRFFDRDTGRLVRTETASGFSIREQGEIVSGGLRLAKSLIQTHKDPDGKEVVTRYDFDRITVNEVFPDSVFAIPPPELPPEAAPVPPAPAVTQPAPPKPSE